MFWCVKTWRTPSRSRAAELSMLLIFPRATPLETTTPYVSPAILYSAAYLARPVTLARPSTRFSGRPMKVVIMIALHLHSLFQGANDAAPGEFNLEIVVA